MASRDLDALIEDHEWARAMDRVRTHPHEARTIVNPSLGWTKLHWLCSIGSTPTEMIELVASLYPEAIIIPDNRYGDTPLHIICRNSQTSAEKIRTLLKHLPQDGEGVLIRNRFGGTALHSASNHNAVLEALQALVTKDRRILRVTTHDGIHAVSALWHSYIQTIPGYMIVARILEGDVVNEGHFERFWGKATFLATEYYRQTRLSRYAAANTNADETRSGPVLHGLLQCNVPINFFKVAVRRNPRDAEFVDELVNLPLHRLLEDRPFRLKEREAVEELVKAFPEALSHPNAAKEFPLQIAIRNKIPWENGVDILIERDSHAIHRLDARTGLYPFQLAASVGGKVSVETTYHLLRRQPDLLECHS